MLKFEQNQIIPTIKNFRAFWKKKAVNYVWDYNGVTGDVNARRCAHAYGNFYCPLPGGVRAHHGLFRARAFETPAIFHIVP